MDNKLQRETLAEKAYQSLKMEITQGRIQPGEALPEEKIAIIPNGIDLSEYVNLPPKGLFKKKLALDDNEKLVLYLGRVHRIKGVDFLVRAFADVVGKLGDVRLVIVGPDDGFLGELHPEILENWEIWLPVAIMEIKLAELPVNTYKIYTY